MPTLINGRTYGWSDITINMLGNSRPILGITEVNWSSEANNEWHHGIGRTAVAFTKGAKKFSGSVKWHKSEFDAFEAALPDGTDLYDIPPFDIVVSYQAGSVVDTKVLKGCIFTKKDTSQNTGTTVVEVNLTFNFLEII